MPFHNRIGTHGAPLGTGLGRGRGVGRKKHFLEAEGLGAPEDGAHIERGPDILKVHRDREHLTLRTRDIRIQGHIPVCHLEPCLGHHFILVTVD